MGEYGTEIPWRERKLPARDKWKITKLVQLVWLCKWRGKDYLRPFTLTVVFNIFENILLKRFYQKQDSGIMTVSIDGPDLLNANEKFRLSSASIFVC